ncbi:uroporphyrinogen-III synthase [uncultured Shimia sp.]|uniref:uroporphyrinogen-III synthase n=1 Tax=uncultured Shimia sp. TaxID=573152 RepID=UPI002608C806|nr:uroporphyrinogen-III synthase [uncultured Shimia sp.]
MTHETPLILLTRPTAAATAFAKKLEGIAAEIVISPVQLIESVPFESPESFTGAIFTSRNGVEMIEGREAPCWCVGDATMEAAKAKGWQAKSAAGDVEALLRRILADNPKAPLVHFRGAFARGDLAERLSREGIETAEIVVYQQVSQALTDQARLALHRENPVILPLFSPRSAAQVVQQGPFEAPLTVVAISEAVAAEAAALGPVQMVVADAPDAVSMVAAIKQVANAG